PLKTQSKFILSQELFDEIDLFGTKHPILVVKTPLILDFKFSMLKETNKDFLFLPSGDPSNLGAILRSALAFNFNNIVLLKEACSPFHPKSVRSASGALNHLHFYEGPSIHQIDPSFKNFYALDSKGESLLDFDPPQNIG